MLLTARVSNDKVFIATKFMNFISQLNGEVNALPCNDIAMFYILLYFIYEVQHLKNESLNQS